MLWLLWKVMPVIWNGLKWFVILTNKSSETQVLPKMIRYIIHLYRHSLVEFNKSEVMVGLRWTVVWVGDGCSNTEVLGVGTVSRGRIVMFSKPYYIRFSIFLVRKRWEWITCFATGWFVTFPMAVKAWKYEWQKLCSCSSRETTNTENV